jgi:hypothetical protein
MLAHHPEERMPSSDVVERIEHYQGVKRLENKNIIASRHRVEIKRKII